MKNFILNFKASVRFFVSIIISREFAVIYCLLGTIAQISHSYFLIESISSLDGNWRTLQALFISIFISSSLLYFVAIADDSDKSEEGIIEFKRVNFAIILFTIIEIIINIYYYSRHLIIDTKNSEYRIFDYIFAILISCLIPITIKLYSSHIRAKNWIIDIELGNEALISGNKEVQHNFDLLEDSENMDLRIKEIKKIVEDYQAQILTSTTTITELDVEQKIDEKLNNLKTEIDTLISSSFNKNQELYLKQFQNKVQLLITQNLDKLK